MRNFEELKELKEQGRTLIERKRDEFVRNSLLSDEFLEMLQKNKKPMDLMMSYYQCAVMEVSLIMNFDFNMIKTRLKGLKQESSPMTAF